MGRRKYHPKKQKDKKIATYRAMIAPTTNMVTTTTTATTTTATTTSTPATMPRTSITATTTLISEFFFSPPTYTPGFQDYSVSSMITSRYFSESEFKAIIDSSLVRPNEALDLLSDKCIVDLLGFNQLIELIGCHTGLALQVLNAPWLAPQLSTPHYELLSKKNYQIAEHLLTHTKLTPIDIVVICKHHIDLANMLKYESFIDLLEHHNLAILGQLFPEIGLPILETTALNGDNLAILGKYHPKIASVILAQYRDKLSFMNLATLGQLQSSIASDVLNMAEFINYASGRELAIIAQNSLEHAAFILDNQNRYMRLNGSDLTILGQRLAPIGHRILNDKDLRSKLNPKDFAELGRYQPEIARRVIEEEFATLDGNCLETLAQDTPEIAELALNKIERPYKILSPDNVLNFIHNAKIAKEMRSFPEISVLASEKILKMLDFADSVNILARTCPKEMQMNIRFKRQH